MKDDLDEPRVGGRQGCKNLPVDLYVTSNVDYCNGSLTGKDTRPSIFVTGAPISMTGQLLLTAGLSPRDLIGLTLL